MTSHEDRGDLDHQQDFRAIEREIAAHPGYKAYVECEVLKRSIAFVFGPNWQELLALLDRAAKDHELAFELIQNAHEPVARDQFYAVLTRHLHNYLASTTSLVEHARCIMRSRTDGVAKEFERQKADLTSHPEISFMQDLRNFTLHRTLPFFAHSLTLVKVNTPQQEMTSEVELNVSNLLRWSGWSSTSKKYLAEAGQVVTLRPVVQKHGELVYWFNRRLYSALSSANEEALEEVNQLIVRRNAALAGVDLKTAGRMTDEAFDGWP